MSTPKKKDPWSLELFESADSNATPEASEDSKTPIQSTSEIPSKSKPQIQKQPSEPPSLVQELFDSKKTLSNVKFRRSLSQPQVSTFRSRSGLFSFRRSREYSVTKESTIFFSPPSYATSDFYLYTLVWGCAIMSLWKNLMLLPALVIPILIYIIKHVGIYLGLWNWLFCYWIKMLDALSCWCTERYDALIPIPIRGLYKVMARANCNVKQSVKDSIDTVASCVVILGLLVFVICASIFIAIQVFVIFM